MKGLDPLPMQFTRESRATQSSTQYAHRVEGLDVSQGGPQLLSPGAQVGRLAPCVVQGGVPTNTKVNTCSILVRQEVRYIGLESGLGVGLYMYIHLYPLSPYKGTADVTHTSL